MRTAGTATLAVRSLILLHDVLESLLIEVPARLVLGRLVDALRPTSCVRDHQVLLVARPRDLRLHAEIVSLVLLLLAQPKHDFVDDLVRWVRSLLTSAARLNQI